MKIGIRKFQLISLCSFCLCAYLFVNSMNSNQLNQKPTEYITKEKSDSGTQVNTEGADVGLKFLIAFGYKDARPARFVGDRYERLSLIEKLLKKCPTPTEKACGFRRHSFDADLFEKKMLLGSQDKKILVKILASSLGPDDDENRKNPYQKVISQNTKFEFNKAVQIYDEVFYVGHSRDGGGPDFEPPKLTQNNHVDCDWYIKEKPGLVDLRKSLKMPKLKVRTLGLISCASEKQFKGALVRANPNLNLVTTKDLVYYQDALEIVMQELDQSIQLKLIGYGQKNLHLN